MTEDEAKTKWCPMTRVQNFSMDRSGAINRSNFDAGNTLCIASKCMMWRWHDPQYAEPGERHGYCGIAGSPAR